MIRTDVNLTKFENLRAYRDFPIVARDDMAYLDTTTAAANMARSCMTAKGLNFEALAKKSGVTAESLAALLDTGVTTVSDALAVFHCLGLRVVALPSEYARTAQ